MIVNVDHWNNKTIKIDYICSRINEKNANHMYVRFDNFSNNFYKIWQNMIKNLTKLWENFDWKINIVNCIWNFVKARISLWILYQVSLIYSLFLIFENVLRSVKNDESITWQKNFSITNCI